MNQWLKGWLSNARAQVQVPGVPLESQYSYSKAEGGDRRVPRRWQASQMCIHSTKRPASDRVEGKDGHQRLCSDLFRHNVTYAHLLMSHTNTHTHIMHKPTNRKKRKSTAGHAIGKCWKPKLLTTPEARARGQRRRLNAEGKPTSGAGCSWECWIPGGNDRAPHLNGDGNHTRQTSRRIRREKHRKWWWRGENKRIFLLH